MKRIEAIIRPQRAEAVSESLSFFGHKGVTVVQARGHGIQGGVTQAWRGVEHRVDLLPKSILAVVVEDQDVEECIDVIVKSARTGRMGDGKIFVTDVEEVIRIRTGEEGSAAI
ncbi:MAG: P-II family nitrogen regulator [Acidimicrobiales bacterium]|nr:P-II family nitrogen regulator [Acidimicrobiales bacterium]